MPNTRAWALVLLLAPACETDRPNRSREDDAGPLPAQRYQRCDASRACVEGLSCCETCTDTSQDPAHCGGCGVTCPAGSACVQGRCVAGGKPVALSDIRAPIFAVGTVWDHVAPWRSTYKLHLQVDTEVTYLLTTGGHNAGIVSPPGTRGRSFQMMTRRPDSRYLDPETFVAEAPHVEGSWWPHWATWLEARSGGLVAPPGLGAPGYEPLGEAPGTYVLQE